MKLFFPIKKKKIPEFSLLRLSLDCGSMFWNITSFTLGLEYCSGPCRPIWWNFWGKIAMGWASKKWQNTSPSKNGGDNDFFGPTREMWSGPMSTFIDKCYCMEQYCWYLSLFWKGGKKPANPRPFAVFPDYPAGLGRSFLALYVAGVVSLVIHMQKLYRLIVPSYHIYIYFFVLEEKGTNVHYL